MEPLITVTQLETRLGHGFTEAERAQAEAFISDASALVRDIADDDFLDDSDTLDVPEAIIPVVTSMVRRALENPRGLSGETIGDYSWQAQGGMSTGTLYATRNEKRIIRRAAGQLAVGTAQLDGYLPRMHSDDLAAGFGREL